MSENELVPPISEYASPVWHPVITNEQSDLLEREQTQALKNVMGLGTSTQKMHTALKLPTLAEWRKISLKKLASKCAGSSKFGHWFLTRPTSLYELETYILGPP